MNKRSTYLLLSAAAVLGCLTGCEVFAPSQEAVPMLSASVASVSMPADHLDGSEVCDTLVVCSNRSWSARLEGGEDWLSIDTREYLNLENSATDVSLVLKAADNSAKQSRSASLVITSQTDSLVVDVEQGQLIPRLAVEGASALEDVVSDNDRYVLSVRSNVAWTVSVAPDATAQVSLSAASGSGNADIEVEVAENLDMDAIKQASIVFAAEDCESISVPLVQRRGRPYIRFTDAVSDSLSVEEGIPGGVIAFKTNSAWSVELESFDGFTQAPVLTTTSGTKDDTSLSFTLPSGYAICFGRKASMKLVFSIAEDQKDTLVVLQTPVLRAKFGTLAEDKSKFTNATAETWPLKEPSFADMGSTKNTSSPYYDQEKDIVLLNDYRLKMSSCAGLWLGSSTGLNGFGSGTVSNYIGLPAIEGHALVKVVYQAAAASTKKLSLSIRKDDKTTIVTGGEQQGVGTTAVARPAFTWELKNTENNTEYYLFQANTGNMYLGDLILYYE